MKNNSSLLRIAITGINRDILKNELKILFGKGKVAKSGRNIENIKYKLDYKNPELIICYGGDGSLLFGEQRYPRIPKIFIHKKKDVRNARKIIESIINNTFKNNFKELIKLEVYVNNKKQDFLAMNDVNIHYTPPEALRFFLKVNGERINKELIGDGVVVSTPFGSSGYFKSITRKTFHNGIGLAFNNTTEKLKSIILNEKDIIDVIITRGCGVVAIDNSKKLIKINKGDKIKIRASKERARVLIYR